MSTFGEIAEPSSRAAWEDWDDIENHSADSPQLMQWKNEIVNSTGIETLFVMEGKYLYDCVKLQTNYTLSLINSIPDVNLFLYKVGETNRYVCTVKNYNLLQSSEIVALLRPLIQISNKTITIQIKTISEYQTSTPSNQPCIVRCLNTSNTDIKIYYPKLEQPNMISGISAGVITLREHLGLSGTAFVCYIENIEEYGVDCIEQLLQKLDILPDIKSKPYSVLDSNLYI